MTTLKEMDFVERRNAAAVAKKQLVEEQKAERDRLYAARENRKR
jgi:hypothetical protein